MINQHTDVMSQDAEEVCVINLKIIASLSKENDNRFYQYMSWCSIGKIYKSGHVRILLWWKELLQITKVQQVLFY